jgi:hypothetical protein
MAAARDSNVRLRLVIVAMCYVVALAVIANFAFGASMSFGRGASTGPARTGSYGGRLPMVTPVDGHQIALAITEATGGAPTIGLQLPPDEPATTTATTTTAAVATTGVTTSPTYKAVAATSTTPNWYNLLSLIPTLKFPGKASPHRR